MHITLQTLSPVHIGTGEALSYLDYYIHKTDYYRISQACLLGFLQAQGPDQLRAYADWIDGISTDLYELETYKRLRGRQLDGKDYNQKLRSLRQELQLSRFLKAQGLENAFHAYLAQPRPGLRRYRLNGNEKQQIRALISTGTEAVYLPGTSLKGAVRTALIYQVLMDDTSGTHKKALLADIRDSLKKFHGQALRAKVGKALEYSTAYCGIMKKQIDHEKGGNIDRRNDRDEMMDLFKFLEISDAPLRPETKEPVEVVGSDLYLTTKVKQRDGSLKREATLQPQAPGMEVIRQGVTFDLEVHIAVDRMFRIYEQVRKQPKRREWLDMEAKVKALYGLDLDRLTAADVKPPAPGEPSPAEAQALAHLHQALRRFAQAQRDFELDWVEKQMLQAPFSFKLPKPEAFRAPFAQIAGYDQSQHPLLRCGFGTGFPGTTELLYVIGDPDLREAFKQVMAKTKLGDKPGFRKDKKPYEPNVGTFPKSRLLITYPQKQVAPLGWLAWMPGKVAGKATSAPSSREPARQTPSVQKPREPIKPQYPSPGERIRPGTILDAFMYKSSTGPEKKVKVYVGKDRDVDLLLSYRADNYLGKIILVEVSAMEGDRVTGVRFKAPKRENRG